MNDSPEVTTGPEYEQIRRQRDANEKHLVGLRRDEAMWSWSRLLTFFAAAAVWYPLRHNVALAVASSGAVALLFVLTVRKHLGARLEREFHERLATVIAETLQRYGGRLVLIRSWQRPDEKLLPDVGLGSVVPGGVTWPLTAQECDDLDLYAPPIGVFGLLNRCSTAVGTQRLSHWLEHPCLEVQAIVTRQEMVRWLHEHSHVRLGMTAAAAGLRNRDVYLAQLINTIDRAEALGWGAWSIALRIWSLISFAVIAYGATKILQGVYLWSSPLVALAFVNTFIYMQLAKQLTPIVQQWRTVRLVVRALSEAFQRTVSQLDAPGPLTKVHDDVAMCCATNVLPSLCRRVQWTEVGGTFHALTNCLFFYDLHVAELVLSRAASHRGPLMRGLAAFADVEALCSLASFAFEQPVTQYPRISRTPGISINRGMHPLIDPLQAVPNDLVLDTEYPMWIITGSNMAGKSTYLRMAGINILLAQIGTAACAAEMTFAPVRLLTDLRIRDNLSKEESYFLSEVRQLRRMVLPELHDTHIFGLIDEPFRGTNSQERAAASVALVEHLSAQDHFFLIATHEQRLTELSHDRTRNHHFREELGASGEVFDHKLHPGPAKIRNALRLMEREGYPAALIAAARAEAQRSPDKQMATENTERKP